MPQGGRYERFRALSKNAARREKKRGGGRVRGSKTGVKNNSSPVKITATKHNALALVGVHAITMVLDADRMGSLQRVERRINSEGREKKKGTTTAYPYTTELLQQ